MWNMICYEFKKLTSNLSGKLILILFFGVCFWQIQQDIKNVNDNKADVMGLKEQQKQMEGSYEGIHKRGDMPNFETDRYHLNSERALDETFMENVYGSNWQQLSQVYEAGTLTAEVWKELGMEKAKFSMDDFKLEYYYADEMMWMNLKRYLPEQEKMLHRSEYLYDKENKTCLLSECDVKSNETTKKEINRRFLALPDQYVSNAVGNQLIGQVTYTNVLLLVMLGILFANIFSKETQFKTDTYLACSPKGPNVVKAKLSVALIIGVLIPFLAKLIVFLYSIWSYGSFDFHMFYYEQDSMIASYIFTFQELFGISFLNYFIGLTSLCICILFISQKSKNNYLAGIVTLLFIILPLFFDYVIDNQSLAALLPSNFLSRLSEQLAVNDFYVQGKHLFVSLFGWVGLKVYVLWGIWVLLDVVMIRLMLRESKQHQIISHA